MPIHSRYVAAGLLIAASSAALVSCGNPTAPTWPPPTPYVSASALAIVVPPEIDPGTQVQLIANATKADGSVENVSSSSQTQWRVDDSAIVQVSPTGLATGRTRGETRVTVSFGGLTVRAPVFVLPKGTFALRGIIKDSGAGVENAFVTVIAGVGTGLTMMTRYGGNFAFYGVAGPVQIEVKKAGYRTSVQQIDVTAHGNLDLPLETQHPRPDYTGTYALTISAAPCLLQKGSFPLNAKRRVYTATVAQDVGRVMVTLSDADLIVTNGYGNRFAGMVEPDGSIVFSIGAADLYYSEYLGHFDIVERFGETAFMAGGTAIVTGTADRLSGSLAGTLEISSRTTAPFLPSSSNCSAKTHGFEMVRR